MVVIAADLCRVGASHALLYHNSVSHDTTWLLSQSAIGYSHSVSRIVLLLFIILYKFAMTSFISSLNYLTDSWHTYFFNYKGWTIYLCHAIKTENDNKKINTRPVSEK